MIIKRSDEHTRVLRQKVVSSAKLRGMSCEQIVALLTEQECINTRTNLPWSVSTIQQDLKRLEEQWRQETLKGISDHRARVLAEIQEVKRSAWAGGKHSIVLRALDQEIALLGLNELERMGVEIALANLLKGFPKEIADQLKVALAKKVAERKAQSKQLTRTSIIDINRASK